LSASATAAKSIDKVFAAIEQLNANSPSISSLTENQSASQTSESRLHIPNGMSGSVQHRHSGLRKSISLLQGAGVLF
jgi:hypothetical protein